MVPCSEIAPAVNEPSASPASSSAACEPVEADYFDFKRVSAETMKSK